MGVGILFFKPTSKIHSVHTSSSVSYCIQGNELLDQVKTRITLFKQLLFCNNTSGLTNCSPESIARQVLIFNVNPEPQSRQ